MAIDVPTLTNDINQIESALESVANFLPAATAAQVKAALQTVKGIAENQLVLYVLVAVLNALPAAGDKKFALPPAVVDAAVKEMLEKLGV